MTPHQSPCGASFSHWRSHWYIPRHRQPLHKQLPQTCRDRRPDGPKNKRFMIIKRRDFQIDTLRSIMDRRGRRSLQNYPFQSIHKSSLAAGEYHCPKGNITAERYHSPKANITSRASLASRAWCRRSKAYTNLHSPQANIIARRAISSRSDIIRRRRISLREPRLRPSRSALVPPVPTNQIEFIVFG